MFHVTSPQNRESIQANGLDWRLMGAAQGIAGSRAPEQEGCFVCRSEHDVDFFVRMGNRRVGPVDVWAVDGIDQQDLIESGEGFYYLPATVPPGRVELIRSNVVVGIASPVRRRDPGSLGSVQRED
jgi:hypothetical protein